LLVAPDIEPLIVVINRDYPPVTVDCAALLRAAPMFGADGAQNVITDWAEITNWVAGYLDWYQSALTEHDLCYLESLYPLESHYSTLTFESQLETRDITAARELMVGSYDMLGC
jgi:hypothetical protein